jgi:hypothetical protein
MTLIRYISFLILVGGLSAAWIDGAAAQGAVTWRGGGGWGPGGAYARLYNAQSVETVRGEVVSVDTIRPMRGMHQGVHLTLKTDKGEIAVHLGPSWYVENQEVKLVPHDTIEVKGSRVTFDGKPAIIAAEVKKGDKVLELRDANGLPVWAGWRQR